MDVPTNPTMGETEVLVNLYREIKDPQTGLKPGHRTWLGIKCDDAFKGSELTDWLQQNKGKSKDCAKEIGGIFLKKGWISHCSSDSLPFTSACFYQFCAKPGWDVPILFIHGIKGAVLADATTKRVKWITPKQAISQKSTGLELPFTWKDGVQDKDNIIPIDILKEVKIVGIGEDIYGGWIKTMHSLRRSATVEFAYDWRRSLYESVALLIDKLEEVKADTGSPVQVVAHSMGGLISMVALNRRPDLFQSVLFAGVPFMPGVGFLEDLHAGTATGSNKEILTPQILSTFTSIWVFFQLNYDDLGTSYVMDEVGNPLKIDFAKVEDWEEYKLGPWSFPSIKDPEALREHMKQALAIAKKFRADLNNVNKDISCPVGVLASKSKPTLEKIVKCKKPDTPAPAIRGYDFEVAARPLGDGRLQMSAANPPSGVKVQQVWETTEGHSTLLDDPKVPEYLTALIPLVHDPSNLKDLKKNYDKTPFEQY